jgi:hypothetical protein
MNLRLPVTGTRDPEPGQRCTCGRPASTILVSELGDVAFCGDSDGPPAARRSEPATGPTVAAVRAVLLEAAHVIEQVGWTQGQSVSLTGAVCVGAALGVAADGDEDAELAALSALQELLPWPSVLEWNDEPERTRFEVLTMLRFAAQAVAA